MQSDLSSFPLLNEQNQYNAIIETPKGKANKYNFDEKLKAFVLKKELPLGSVFPFDFGFLPSTIGGDGDPLDILILMDEPAYPGIIVPSRIVGAIKAVQTEKDGKEERNDRLIGVSEDSHLYSNINEINDLPPKVIEQVEHFFISYNEIKGKKFEPLDKLTSQEAKEIIQKGSKRFKEKS